MRADNVRMGAPGDSEPDRLSESEEPGDSLRVYHRSGKSLSEYEREYYEQHDGSGCLVVAIIVVALLLALLGWAASWSCGPGKGQCSWASMPSIEVAALDGGRYVSAWAPALPAD